MDKPLLQSRRMPCTQSLRCLSSCLVDMCRPGQREIKGHPKLPWCLYPLCWLSEKLDWSGLLDAYLSRSKQHCSALCEIDSNPPVPLATAQACRGESPNNWREAMVCGTWLRQPCRSNTVPARRGRKGTACLHADWTAQWDKFTLRYTSSNGTTCRYGWLKGRLERSAWRYEEWFSPSETGSLGKKLVKATFVPNGVKVFSHIQENSSGNLPSSKLILTENKAGQLQRRGKSGSEPELLVMQQTALVYFSYDPIQKDLHDELANSVKLTNGSVGRRQPTNQPTKS
jgi:hypothetical protein